jgi:hypothetical protein
VKQILLPVLLFCTSALQAATFYVDSSSAGARNGTSWANAWTSLDQIAGVAPGDTVFISGGPAGQSRTYNRTSSWLPISGSASAKVNYKIGQDSQHNGTAIFNCNGNNFIDRSNGWVEHVVISGDAGDGAKHFRVNNANSVISCPGGYFTNSRFSYVDCGDTCGGFAWLTETTHVELDHVYLKQAVPDAWGPAALIYGTSGDLAYDSNLLHDCQLLAPVTATTNDGVGGSNGNDVLRLDGSGWSVYNNVIEQYSAANYPLDHEHADGWQHLGGSYCKLYNNTFLNIANYAVYFTPEQGPTQHFLCYNNTLAITDPFMYNREGSAGIIFGFGPETLDVHVENNMIVDYKWHGWGCADDGEFRDWNSPNFERSGELTNVTIRNNVFVNTDNVELTPGTYGIDAAVVSSNNVSISSASAPSTFMAYTANATGNNYHLKGTDTVCKSRGMNLSSMFKVYQDNALRAASGNWDIGPLGVPVSQPNPTPTPTPTPTPSSTQSMFPSTYTPAGNGIAGSAEYGVKFSSSQAGKITAIKWYRPGNATSSGHYFTLWSSSGTVLATATSSAESGTGWMTVPLRTPVSILANTTYVASIHTYTYPYTDNYFVSQRTRGVFTIPPNAGVKTVSGAVTFPTTASSTNYWLDVVFQP